MTDDNTRCTHGVWRNDHCYECGKPAPAKPTEALKVNWDEWTSEELRVECERLKHEKKGLLEDIDIYEEQFAALETELSEANNGLNTMRNLLAASSAEVVRLKEDLLAISQTKNLYKDSIISISNTSADLKAQLEAITKNRDDCDTLFCKEMETSGWRNIQLNKALTRIEALRATLKMYDEFDRSDNGSGSWNEARAALEADDKMKDGK